MKERLKQLRKALGFTQQEFADNIGVKRSTIAQYEIGRNEPIDPVVNVLCKQYNVSEQWLRTGEGEMFVQISREEELSMLLGNLLTDETAKYKRAIISTMLRMDDNAWTALDHFLDELIEQRKNIT